MQNFERSIKLNGERYVTELPFRPDHDKLPDNYDVSRNRLFSLIEKRLKPDANLSQEYDRIFKEYLDQGIIEEVPASEVAKEDVYYLPHHPVVRRDKATTKVRVVFDGSCKTHKPSLNDILYSGPNLLSKLFNILR